ncbi:MULTISPECIES: NADPH-dependent FMN reductase [Bacillus cereus group]|uniref:Azoreductase ( NAD(P)H oxidoreductase, quinone reductase ) n=1 Tax=Bacillus thuringiensis TaxID=1428 RepID=A0A1C4E3R5_BACTU|nr:MULTISPECIES: NAD(P)H-dependent oxidoreductase [Bacillus cereus group]MED3025666.1 NAD(P)H-dependent oxidoreductase [Bacillus wiedmannii]OTX98530.1 hypothetical protein BK729_13265 [Bacillus thuringiensis serovar wratislaviensis]OUB59132.1 hypothetical protein BK743_13160 [Bacillus thuringiensis serovar sylvestriensis]SCC38155.1 Azoreductase (NAD(P)H oxidoreductase, quinone reductase) [Bacillus thuringiensis]
MSNILIICGSPRKNANTRGLSTKLKELLVLKGMNATTFDLGSERIPLYSGEESDYNDSNVKALIQKISMADAVIICTPEYHSAMSGALKNMLDYLNGNHFINKQIAVFGVAGGGKGGINALNNLRTTLRSLYCNVLPEQLIIDSSLFEDNRLKEKDAEDYLKKINYILEKLIICIEKNKITITK